MEEEIDLRPYIELIIRRWYVILGAAILAGLIAFGVTSLQDPIYEATALVAVTQERLVANFDPRLDTTEERQPVNAFPELATSDEFLNVLLEEIDPRINGIETVDTLRRRLAAEPGADPSLIRLTVLNNDPEVAARIANLWAEQFVLLANDIYGDGGQEQVTFFEEQLAQSGDDLATAEQSLVTFQSVNRMAVISNTMSSIQQQQTQYLNRQYELSDLIVDIQDLHDQLSDVDGSAPVTFADQLTVLTLQLRAYNAALDLPIQIQLESSRSLSDATRSEQVTVLESLIVTLQSRFEDITQEITVLEPELLQLQGELQEAQAEFNRLTLNRNIAEETYQSLARKVDEERITAEDMTRGIRLASQAAVTEEPVSKGLIINVIIAAILGVVISIIVLIFLYVGRDSDSTS